MDGLRLSGGDPANAEDFLAVLRYLKANNMKLQVETTGKNSHILETVLAENLADVMAMDVKGPKELYSSILGEAVDIKDVEKSITLVSSSAIGLINMPEVRLAQRLSECLKEHSPR